MKGGMGQGGQAPAAPNGGLQGFLQGIRPEQGSQQQLELVQALLSNVGASAAQTNSPLAAFLAPMAATAMQGRAQNMRDQRIEEASAGARDTIFTSSDKGTLLDLMMNDDIDPRMQRIAGQRLTTLMNPPRGRAAERIDFGDRNTAIETLQDAIRTRIEGGETPQEARDAVMSDPMYRPLLDALNMPTTAPTAAPATQEEPQRQWWNPTTWGQPDPGKVDDLTETMVTPSAEPAPATAAPSPAPATPETPTSPRTAVSPDDIREEISIEDLMRG